MIYLLLGALDNFDHNPSSTTAKDSFRGTGISLFQFLSEVNKGTPQAAVNSWSTTSKSLKLPDSYIYYSAVTLRKENVQVPSTSLPVSGAVTKGHLKEAI